MNVRSGIKWTKLVVVLTFMCSISGFSALAQIDAGKPLDARTLAALVLELKGVVQRTAPDANEAAMVAQKWDARRDLAGKTKLAVINLLFQDVRSSIKDSGTQYQISSMFGMYKMMPDDAIKAERPQADASMSKPALVNKLIDLTYAMHPDVGAGLYVHNVMVPFNIKGTEAREAAARRDRFALFDFVLRKNKTWTPAQRSFIKANYDQLLKITIKITEDAERKNLPVDKWVKEGLQKSYTSKFTPAELSSLISYFEGIDGQDILRHNKTMSTTDLAEEFPAKGDTAAKAAEAKYDKFLATPLGAKFKTAYFDEVSAYKESKEKAAWTADLNADGTQVYLVANLDQLFDKFVAENYKK